MRAKLGAVAAAARGALMRRELWPYLALTLIFVGLQIYAFAGVEPHRAPDTQTYEGCGAKALWNPELYACLRGFTLPLYYKLVAGDELRIVGQLIISIAAWSYLAIVVARAITHRVVRLLAFAAILLFSCSFTITTWDGVLLSESLGLSLAAVVVGAWIAFLRNESATHLTTLVVASVLWAFDRDANAFLLLLTVPFIAIWLTRPGRKRVRWIALAATAAIFAAVSVSADSPKASFKRWPIPLTNVIRLRVLPDREALHHFEDAGMPTLPRLEGVTDSWNRGDDWFQNPNPVDWQRWAHMVGGARVIGVNGYYSIHWPERRGSRSKPFQDWLLESGRGTYARFLAAHPLEALASAWRNRDVLMAPPAYGQGRPAVPAGVQDVTYPPSFTALVIAFLAVVAVAAFAGTRGGASIIWWVPGVLVVLTVPHALFVWLASAREVERHALLVAVLARLGILILFLFAIDALLARRPEPSASSAPDEGDGSASAHRAPPTASLEACRSR